MSHYSNCIFWSISDHVSFSNRFMVSVLQALQALFIVGWSVFVDFVALHNLVQGSLLL